MNDLLKISLRQNAVFIPKTALVDAPKRLSQSTGLLVANLGKYTEGYRQKQKTLQTQSALAKS
jgi:hypothetical protein